MRKGVLVLIVSLIVLIFQAEAAASDKPVFYQLTYQTENAAGQILINGFVVTEVQPRSGNGTAALNPWLTGENELRVELKKADSSKPTQFTCGLSETRWGEVVSTMDKGKLFSLELTDKDFAGTGKVQAAKRFASTLNFRRHLSEAEQAKESDVLAYAQQFFSLFIKKDAEGILRESEIKIIDYSQAFGGADMKSELRTYLTEELFKSRLNKLNPKALRALPVGPSKTIWHVFNGRHELIKAQSP
ncbi:MAG TPA: hypothetical protein DCR97_10785, partial [Deltaproteobacteria bacterium]|nr:hypothetical protein [Deltaproteobacteria bacterium]